MEDQILSKLNELTLQIKALRSEIESLKLSIMYMKQSPLLQDPNACIDEFGHDYPSPWFGTIPPYCRKCGKQANGTFITYGINTNAAGFDFNQFGGNMMYSKDNVNDNSTADDGSNEEDDLITSYGR
jgi:hypothetical protein